MAMMRIHHRCFLLRAWPSTPVKRVVDLLRVCICIVYYDRCIRDLYGFTHAYKDFHMWRPNLDILMSRPMRMTYSPELKSGVAIYRQRE